MLTCPNCQSTRVVERHIGRDTGGALGTIAGSATGVAAALASP